LAKLETRLSHIDINLLLVGVTVIYSLLLSVMFLLSILLAKEIDGNNNTIIQIDKKTLNNLYIKKYIINIRIIL
jgi:hypothetical protein